MGCAHPHIRPICLPTDTSEMFADLDAIVTGWGTTISGDISTLSSTLLEVMVKTMSNDKCKNDYGYSSSQITSNMLCANVEGGGKDSCQVLIPIFFNDDDNDDNDDDDDVVTVLGRLRWPSD